ncbi:MAG: hypothetical protein J6D09_02865 [Clostridia bacterium]|nr:hypothetical protein [Clostridia bacterium]
MKKKVFIILCSITLVVISACIIIGIILNQPASVVTKYEKERAKEIALLKKEKPGSLISTNNRADRVEYLLLLRNTTDGNAEKFVKKYNLKKRFPKAEIEAGYGVVTLEFKRNDYTKAVHDALTNLTKKSYVQSGSPHIYPASGIWYKPDISLYAENPTKIEHAYPNRRQETLDLPESDVGVHDVGRIITTKADYDAYIGLFAENYDYYPEGLEILEYKKSLYDEEFFKTNALLVTKKVVRDELGYAMGVSDVYLSDNKIYVVICRSKPEGLSVGMTQNPFCITVSKDAIKGATELITLD